MHDEWFKLKIRQLFIPHQKYSLCAVSTIPAYCEKVGVKLLIITIVHATNILHCTLHKYQYVYSGNTHESSAEIIRGDWQLEVIA